jgi:hypothetical protein
VQLILRERDGSYALSDRGWQRIVVPLPTEDVPLRLRRVAPSD